MQYSTKVVGVSDHAALIHTSLTDRAPSMRIHARLHRHMLESASVIAQAHELRSRATAERSSAIELKRHIADIIARSMCHVAADSGNVA